MGKRIGKEKIERKKGYLYYLGKDGFVWQVPTKTNKAGKKQKLGSEKIERKAGFMYYVDKAGYVAEAKLKNA